RQLGQLLPHGWPLGAPLVALPRHLLSAFRRAPPALPSPSRPSSPARRRPSCRSEPARRPGAPPRAHAPHRAAPCAPPPARLVVPAPHVGRPRVRQLRSARRGAASVD